MGIWFSDENDGAGLDSMILQVFSSLNYSMIYQVATFLLSPDKARLSSKKPLWFGLLLDANYWLVLYSWKDYFSISKLEAQQLGECTRGGRNIAAITVVFIQRSLHVHSGCLVSPKNKKLVKLVSLCSFIVVIWKDLGH